LLKRTRERGRKPVRTAWSGSSIPEVVYNDGHAEPLTQQRWEDRHYETRLKNDLLRHKLEESVSSRSQLRQLSRGVGSGGRPAISRSEKGSARKKWVG